MLKIKWGIEIYTYVERGIYFFFFASDSMLMYDYNV